jgi:hypothetical protein
MRYPTKVDTWLAAVLGLALVPPVAAAVVGVASGGFASPAAWLPLVITAATVAVVAVVAVPTYYEVGQDRLVIRSGVLRWEVPLAAISEIAPSSSPMSSPAWSLDRLEVRSMREGKPRSILISPRSQEDFLRAVAARDAGLVLDGRALRRAR